MSVPMAGKSLSAGDDGLIRRWDLESGEPVGDPLAGHTGKARGVSYVSGRALDRLGRETDKTVRVWDANTGADRARAERRCDDDRVTSGDQPRWRPGRHREP